MSDINKKHTSGAEPSPDQNNSYGTKTCAFNTRIIEPGTLVVEIKGDLDHNGVSSIYHELMAAAKKHDGKIKLVLPENVKWDSSALALLSIIEQYGADTGKIVEIAGLDPQMEEFLNKVESCQYRRSEISL